MNTNREITKALHDLGVPSHLSGYRYLHEAVKRAVERPIQRGDTMALYEEVAGELNASGKSVERAMRHAIEIAWLRSSQEIQERYFGRSVPLDSGKPSNRQFIVTLAEHIAMGVMA